MAPGAASAVKAVVFQVAGGGGGQRLLRGRRPLKVTARLLPRDSRHSN